MNRPSALERRGGARMSEPAAWEQAGSEPTERMRDCSALKTAVIGVKGASVMTAELRLLPSDHKSPIEQMGKSSKPWVDSSAAPHPLGNKVLDIQATYCNKHQLLC